MVMKGSCVMKFTKMHGLGNDYIYFNCFEENVANPQELSIRLSHRHFGVGGDGIVLIMPSETCDFRMRMFNADGSEGKMCGNASRCIGKYVFEKGLTDKTVLTLETLGGVKTLTLETDGKKVKSVSVDMGKAEFDSAKIPVIFEKAEVIDEPVNVAGSDWRINCVSMGNPHCVIFTGGIDNLPLSDIGPLFENHPMFPERINTEFVEIKDKTHLKMRVWERGSGETMACGTGASAAVSVAVRNGICDHDVFVTVSLLGGELSVMYRSDKTVIMKGTADFVFEGVLCDGFNQ